MEKFLVPQGEVGLSTPVVSVPKTLKTIKKWNCVVLRLLCSCFDVDVVFFGMALLRARFVCLFCFLCVSLVRLLLALLVRLMHLIRSMYSFWFKNFHACLQY